MTDLLQVSCLADWLSTDLFLPLTTPGCPPPGESFLDIADSLLPSSEESQQGRLLAVQTTYPDTKSAKYKRAAKAAKEQWYTELLQPGGILEELYRRATFDPTFILLAKVKAGADTQIMPAKLVLGHLRGTTSLVGTGPVGCTRDIMVVGKNPGLQEVEAGKNLIGPSGQLLWDELFSLGVSKQDLDGWYLTNLVKHQSLDPAANKLSLSSIKDFLPVLYQELAIVRPRLIICLGVDAAKGLLSIVNPQVVGKGFTIRQTACTTYPGTLPGPTEDAETEVVVVTHPAAVLHQADQRGVFVDGLRYCVEVCTRRQLIGDRSAPVVTNEWYDPSQRDWRAVWYADDLERLVEEICQEFVEVNNAEDPTAQAPLVFVDCEWHGQRPFESGSYLRSLQFSHKAGFACCIMFTDVGGQQGFLPHRSVAALLLRRLFDPEAARHEGRLPTRVAGHHLRADLPWIRVHLGDELADLMLAGYDPGDDFTAWQSGRTGGHDLMYAAHAIRETGWSEGFKLEYVCQSLLGVPRWNRDLENWVTSHCAQRKIPKDQLEGYGHVPYEIFFPYSCSDVDYPRLALDRFLQRPGGWLDADPDKGLYSWPGYYSSMLSAPAFLEMEETGVYVDKPLAEKLRLCYELKANTMLTQIRETIDWPEFNPNSSYQVRELLFGENLNRTKPPRRLRPEKSVSYYLTPVRSCGKGAKEWEKLVSTGQDHLYNPAADKEVLGILGATCPVAKELRDLRFLKRICSSFLTEPVAYDVIDEEELASEDPDDELFYDSGLMQHVSRLTSRIYSHFFPTTETGRTRSARPNLQNWSKRREKDYKRILGQENYLCPMRAILAATPPASEEEALDPWVLVDFDLKGAELFVAAVQSGDAAMIDHTRRNAIYPENHPDHYDIHSSMCVRAFKLKCAPNKKALQEIGMSSYRDISKTLVFGKIYGSGDERIVRALAEEGTIVTLQEVMQMSKTLWDTYPRLGEYLAACHQRVSEHGWMQNCFGRLRRFPALSGNSREVQESRAKLQREAGNWPIQSCVADLVHRWMRKIYQHPEKFDSRTGQPRYRLLLQVHDALLAECRVSFLRTFRDSVVAETLKEVKLLPVGLDGTISPKRQSESYTLASDFHVYDRWGVSLTPERARELHVPEEFLD